jgi:hypothetical protein
MVYANADQCFIVLNESWRLCKPDAITPVDITPVESAESTECGVEGCNPSSAMAITAKWAALDWDFLEGQLGLLKTVRDTPAGWHVWFPFSLTESTISNDLLIRSSYVSLFRANIRANNRIWNIPLGRVRLVIRFYV